MLQLIQIYRNLFIVISVLIGNGNFIYRKVQAASINQAYYVYNEGLLEWQAAEEFCVEKGMHLVSIETVAESNFLKNFIHLRYQKMPPYWIGGHKLNNTWYWIGTGEEIKHFIWHAGEPNDLYNNEACIHTWVNEFNWNDDRCNEELPFICELNTI